ncbi:hypothetical protein HPB50_003031 [Hyalomma asiaticum]|uniref:Uncharacterized protein n=1 Tax=Hyalomma asiaticum TaxID=266040 RepID=A0ACB7SB86_HYAAI|nr:hypothetical protein HPB50_003031 [Hyalomma asiaticum]
MSPEDEQLQEAKRTTALKPHYPRARRSRRSLSTVPAFVVVLLSTAGCSVVLGALVSLYTAYSAHADLRAHGITIDVRTNKFNMSSLEDTSCQSLFCHWNKNYIMGVVDDAKDPCDDFYAHVCNPQRWYRAGSSRVLRPFADFSAAQLIEDMERFFRYYVELRGKPVGDNFLARMMWVYDACRRGTGAKRNASAELADIFNALGLSGAARPDGAIAARVARVIAFGDRHLRLHPLFKVHVWAGGGTKATASYDLVLSAPDTLYHRFIINYPGSTDSQYVDLVARALTHVLRNDSSIFHGQKNYAVGEAIGNNDVVLGRAAHDASSREVYVT